MEGGGTTAAASLSLPPGAIAPVALPKSQACAHMKTTAYFKKVKRREGNFTCWTNASLNPIAIVILGRVVSRYLEFHAEI